MVIYSITILLLVVIFFICYLAVNEVDDEEIESLIVEDMLEVELEVESVSKLSTNDKIRHKLPLFSTVLFNPNHFWNWIWRPGLKHYRIVEVKNNDGQVYLLYMELFVSRKKLIDMEEFDSYEM